jgi:hypothetical protein
MVWGRMIGRLMRALAKDARTTPVLATSEYN